MARQLFMVTFFIFFQNEKFDISCFHFGGLRQEIIPDYLGHGARGTIGRGSLLCLMVPRI